MSATEVRRGMLGSRWRWLALALLVIPAGLGVSAFLATKRLGGDGPLGPLRGLSLGYGPAQVRHRLVTDSPGSFRLTADGEDFALDWTPEGASRELKAARLEFHLGQLVAVRLTVAPHAPEADGPEFELTGASLLTRERRSDGSIELTWLARSCPTHADEVRRLIANRR